MKKIILFALPAMMLLACGNKTQSAAPTADTTATDTVAATVQAPAADPTPEVKEAVNAIYGEVSKEKFMDDIIKKYGSADLKKSLDAYNKATAASGADIGAIDYDVFVQGQDFNNFSFDVTSVEMTGDNAADAKVSMENCGQKSTVTLKMVKEDGKWLIDDIIGQAGDAKKVMKENS